jgi:hypothetical protein
LILKDSASILKGGKSGELFVAGNPELSLLMERIHLPIEDKKHMPPSGKMQLTTNEISLLTLWISGNAGFKQKVVELSADDPLRILASGILEPSESEEERYLFEAADEQTVQKLNNDYRHVSPVAIESPALAVNIYNKEVYTAKTLEELSEVKTQIVFLNLNEMPVKDLDLKSVSQFENLWKLHLNFTDITGEGLKELASLKHLKSLSLSGTKVNFQDLQEQIPSFKSLNKIAVWNTALTDAEILQLQEANKHIEFIAGFKDDGSNSIKPNPSK